VRIARLDLHAFGPFTDLSLDLSGGAPGGLHVVYGPNESGKSSALRAVLSLLYGFEERTRDGHLHGNENLKVGGLLEANGTQLEALRLKKRKSSLRDAQGEPLDEALLRRMLGGVDRATFEHSFGLGHAELKAGGERMLRGEAGLGETLFDAGAGGADVRRVLARLGDEQERLYVPRGKKKEIHLLFERQAEARRRSQEALLLPESFEQQAAQIERNRLELAELAARIETRRAEQYRVRALKNALPTLQRRAEALKELVALGTVTDISDAAVERRERAQARAGEARAAAARLSDVLSSVQQRLAQIAVPYELLKLPASQIEEWSDAVGRTRKAREDRPRRADKLRELEAEAEATLRRLGHAGSLATAPVLEVSRADAARVRELASEYQKLVERRESASARRADVSREAAELRSRLARMPAAEPVALLERVATLARSLGDLDAPLAELERKRAALAELLGRRRRELLPFRGELGELAALSVPSPETLERLAAELSGCAAREAALRDELRVLERRLPDATGRVARIQAGGAVPSEAELERARAERDELMERIARVAEAPRELGGALRELGLLSHAADAIADRLRREAGRVAELAQAVAERERLGEELAKLRAELADAESARSGRERAIAELAVAAGLGEQGPGELRGFLARREQVLDQFARLEELERDLERLRADRARLRKAAEVALGEAADPDAPLAFLVERCAAVERRRTQLENERSELERAIDAVELRFSNETRELEAAKSALAEWRAAFAAALEPLHAEAETSPMLALELLDEIGSLVQQQKRIEELAGRIQGMQRDEARLSAEVSGPAAEHGIAFDPAFPERAAQELVDRYRSAESAESERARLRVQCDECEAELEAENAALAAAERSVAELCAAVGARDARELVLLEAHSRRARELRASLEAIEATLVDTSGGRSVAALVEEAVHEDAPRLAARLDELERELAELVEERERLADQKASLAAGLERQRAAGGAEAAQEEQAALAELRERVERYARLRVATALLDRAIERYRLENQAPILKRASELFPRLTEGRYTGLRVGREEDGIVALRADGRECTPAELSEGAGYQLYLALRLASIERFVAGAVPLPLVLDDVMIHSDDARKRAAFSVLGELSHDLQILFFTHHERDVELALEAAPGRAVRHELARRG
jgi:uncharacterized protein YhaN